MADRDRIATLLPRHARFSARAIDGVAPPLFAEEARHVERAVEKRRRGFAFGRACARAALGIEIPIPVGEGGAPVWPAGTFGSITHTDDDAAAAVWTAPIGIDLESRAAVARVDLIDLVALPSERRHDPALVFSAKESVYKCLYTGQFLEFRDVELAFADDTFRVLVAGDYEVGDVVGRWLVTDTHVATVAFRTARAAPAV